jgi:hypothetical protein
MSKKTKNKLLSVSITKTSHLWRKWKKTITSGQSSFAARSGQAGKHREKVQS